MHVEGRLRYRSTHAGGATDLIERLWDSLSDDDVPLTDSQRQELEHSLDALDREGSVGVPWEQVLDDMGGTTK